MTKFENIVLKYMWAGSRSILGRMDFIERPSLRSDFRNVFNNKKQTKKKYSSTGVDCRSTKYSAHSISASSNYRNLFGGGVRMKLSFLLCGLIRLEGRISGLYQGVWTVWTRTET